MQLIREKPNREQTSRVSSRTERTVMYRFVTFVAVLLSGLALAGPVSGQAASTTGQIRGQVLQQTGAPAATAVVTVVNTGTGLERTALTDAEGRYVVRLLPPGSYSVTTQVIGFADSVREQVPVTIGQATTVDFTIAVQAVQIEGIQVQAQRDQIDASGANVAQLVTVDQIENLPSLGRDFVDFIELSGFVTSDPGETTGGQFSIAGQRPSGTNLQIDGVDAKPLEALLHGVEKAVFVEVVLPDLRSEEHVLSGNVGGVDRVSHIGLVAVLLSRIHISISEVECGPDHVTRLLAGQFPRPEAEHGDLRAVRPHRGLCRDLRCRRLHSHHFFSCSQSTYQRPRYWRSMYPVV